MGVFITQDEEKKYNEIYGKFDWERFARQHLDWNPAERLNIAHEALDRHAHDPKKVALFCVLPGVKEEKYTYRELKNLSSKFANVLRGLGIKKGIILANTIGVIDSDYQGEIKIGLFNRSQNQYNVKPAERICQMLFIPVIQATLKLVREFSNATYRGSGGFGHTGRD